MKYARIVLITLSALLAFGHSRFSIRRSNLLCHHCLQNRRNRGQGRSLTFLLYFYFLTRINQLISGRTTLIFLVRNHRDINVFYINYFCMLLDRYSIWCRQARPRQHLTLALRLAQTSTILSGLKSGFSASGE